MDTHARTQEHRSVGQMPASSSSPSDLEIAAAREAAGHCGDALLDALGVSGSALHELLDEPGR